MVEAKINREEFIKENLGLVHSICRRFSGRGIEYDDLYQAGCVGLIKAADRFEEERGLCFSTYAVPAILGEIKRIFRDGGAVKVSRSLKELSLRVSRERNRLSLKMGREPTVAELAEEMGVESEQIAEAICAGATPVSLTVTDSEEQSELDIAFDERDSIYNRVMVDAAVSILDERDRRIIELRYFGEKTQSQTAKQLGMTQVQISRREKAILMQLKKYLNGESKSAV